METTGDRDGQLRNVSNDREGNPGHAAIILPIEKAADHVYIPKTKKFCIYGLSYPCFS